SSRSPSDTSASPHLYPASLHDALPISIRCIRYRFERELRRNLHAIANIAQTLAGNRRIHGHQQGIKTFFLCALQKIERSIAFFPQVELEPTAATSILGIFGGFGCSCDFFNRAGAHRR